jgi:hypothetical protein
MGKEEFRQLSYQLIDEIAQFMDTIAEKPVTTGTSPLQLQAIIDREPLPEMGTPAGAVLAKASHLLLTHSLLNGHPKFLGYWWGFSVLENVWRENQEETP